MNYYLASTIDKQFPDSNDTALESEKNTILEFTGLCLYCRKNQADRLDHFVPKIKNKVHTGYGNDTANMIKCCSYCNSSKGNKSFDEWKNAPKDDIRWNAFKPFHTKNAIVNLDKINIYREYQKELELFIRDFNNRVIKRCKDTKP